VTLYFLLILAFVFFMALGLLQISGFFLLRIGLVQFVVFALFIFSLVGTIPLYFNLDEYRLGEKNFDQLLVFKVMIFSGLTILLFVSGAIFAKTFMRSKGVLNIPSNLKINKTEFLILLLLLIVVLLVLIDFICSVPSVALLVVLLENVQDSKIARSMMGNDFSGKYHWYSLFMHDLANIVCFSLFAIFLLRKKLFFFFIFFISFLISSFSALMATEKAPFAWLVLGLLLVYFLMSHQGRIRLKYIIPAFVLMFVLLSFLYISFMGTDNIWQAFTYTFSRAFAGSVQPAYHYLQYFPAHHEFLLGTSFPNPGGILPHQHFPLSKEIMNWVNPSGVKNNIIGSMPTVFWGEAYANYSYLGIIIIPFIMGHFVFIIHHLSSKFVVSPLGVGFYVWIMLHYKNLSTTGFSGFVIDVYFIFISLIIIFVFAFCKLFISIFKKNIKNYVH